MGQRPSRRTEIDLESLPPPSFSAPSRYSPQRFDKDNVSTADGLPDDVHNAPPNCLSAGIELTDKDFRRPSIYSTIDAVPQLDFYANSLVGRNRRKRPSLDVLRKSFEVRLIINNTTPVGPQSVSIPTAFTCSKFAIGPEQARDSGVSGWRSGHQ